MRKDACERNGVAMRKYGLNLIMSKLNETAKIEAALIILATIWLLPKGGGHFFPNKK